MTLQNSWLRCVAFMSTLAAMQRDAWVDLDSILVFFCIAWVLVSDHQEIAKDFFVFRKLTQFKALHHFVSRPLHMYVGMHQLHVIPLQGCI